MHIGDMLLQSGELNAEQLKQALDYQKEIGGLLGQILVKLGFIDEKMLLQTLAKQLNVEAFDLDGFVPQPELMETLPQEVIERLLALPLRKNGSTLVVGLADPTDFAGVDELRINAGGAIEPLLVSMAKARDLIQRYFHPEEFSRANRRVSARVSRGRSGLSNLVHDLERDADLNRAPNSVDTGALDDLSTRELLLGLVAALTEKGLLSEREVTDALARLLGQRSLPSAPPASPTKRP